MALDLKTTVFHAKEVNLLSAERTEPVTIIRPPLPFAFGWWRITGYYRPRWFIAFGRCKNTEPDDKENARAS
jgi:hypothetical protein